MNIHESIPWVMYSTVHIYSSLREDLIDKCHTVYLLRGAST